MQPQKIIAEKNYFSKYYNIDEGHNIEIPNKNKSLSLVPNACSLNKNFDDLQHLLSCTKKQLLTLIGVTEIKITKQVSLLNSLNRNNYS